MLTKSPRYYYDAKSISEPLSYPKETRRPLGSKGAWDIDGRKQGENGGGAPYSGYPQRRNRRDVWTVSTKPYREAHFATFPPDLIEPCILAGSKKGDTILDPFNGAGTTGLVSLENGRNYIGLELNPEYIELSNKRLENII